MQYLKYFIILFLVAIPFSIFFSFYPNDFYPTSIAAHTGYLAEFQGGEASERYEVNLLKGGSFYYLFYFLAYPLLNNTMYVIALYYYLYFVLWGAGTIYALKAFGKLNIWNFLLAFSISVNESMIYGVASFMVSMAYLIFSYVTLEKKLNNLKEFLLFSFISLIILHFLHPYSSLFLIFISFYIATKKFNLNKKEWMIYVGGIFLAFLMIEIGVSLLFSYGNSRTTQYYLNLFLKKPVDFLYHTFIERKVSHFFFQNRIMFHLYVPILAYIASFGKLNREGIKLGFLMLLFMLIVPESFPTTQSFGWRFVPLALLILFLNAKNENKIIKYLSIVLFLSCFIVLFRMFFLGEVINPLNYRAFSFVIDSTYQLFNLLKEKGYNDIIIVGKYNFFFPYLLEIMDKYNFTYSNSYTFSSHPVSPIRGISANDEVKFIKLFKDEFEQKKMSKEETAYYIGELCKNYDIVLEYRMPELLDVYEESYELIQPVRLFECKKEKFKNNG